MRAPRYLTAWAQHDGRQHSQPPPQKSQHKVEPKAQPQPYRNPAQRRPRRWRRRLSSR